MHRVSALGLDDATTHQVFEIFDRVMIEFAAVRKEYGSHDGLRNVIAVAMFEVLQDGERNLRVIELAAVNAGRGYLKKLRYL